MFAHLSVLVPTLGRLQHFGGDKESVATTTLIDKFMHEFAANVSVAYVRPITEQILGCVVSVRDAATLPFAE